MLNPPPLFSNVCIIYLLDTLFLAHPPSYFCFLLPTFYEHLRFTFFFVVVFYACSALFTCAYCLLGFANLARSSLLPNISIHSIYLSTQKDEIFRFRLFFIRLGVLLDVALIFWLGLFDLFLSTFDSMVGRRLSSSTMLPLVVVALLGLFLVSHLA